MQFKGVGDNYFLRLSASLMSITFDSSLFLCAESNVVHGWYWKSVMLLFVIEYLYNILVRKYSLIYIIFVQFHLLIQTPMYSEDPLYISIYLHVSCAVFTAV